MFEALTNYLDGGASRTQQRRRYLEILAAEPIFDNKFDIFGDRKTQYLKALARARRLKELQAQLGIENDALSWQLLRYCASFDDPTSLHELMFVPNATTLCCDAQLAKLLPKCRTWEVIGCYAQTEIGKPVLSRNVDAHGSL